MILRFLTISLLLCTFSSAACADDFYEKLIRAFDTDDLDTIEAVLGDFPRRRIDGDGVLLFSVFETLVKQEEDEKALRALAVGIELLKRGADVSAHAGLNPPPDAPVVSVVSLALHEWESFDYTKDELKFRRGMQFFDMLFQRKSIPNDFLVEFMRADKGLDWVSLIQHSIMKGTNRVRDYLLSKDVDPDHFNSMGWNLSLVAAATADIDFFEAMKKRFGRKNLQR